MPTHLCPVCQADSETSDYCDSCGTALDPPGRHSLLASAQAEVAPALAPSVTAIWGAPSVAGSTACPGCGSPHQADDLFCEDCGCDFTTGELPRPPAAPAPAPPNGSTISWTAVIDADRPFFDANLEECTEDFSFPEGPMRREVPLRGADMVIGRRHEAEGFFPDIDLTDPVLDPGVSRRHAVLRRQQDETWRLSDTGSTNGTWLNEDPVPLKPGVLIDLHDGDRISLGLFTVMTLYSVRKVTS